MAISNTQPRDWSLLATWLNTQWEECEDPYHKGLFEGRAEVAEFLRGIPAGEREAALYGMLLETLMGTVDSGDDGQ